MSMDKPKTPEEAFKMAATMAVTAATDEQCNRAVEHMEYWQPIIGDDACKRICSEIEQELKLNRDPAAGSSQLVH